MDTKCALENVTRGHTIAFFPLCSANNNKNNNNFDSNNPGLSPQTRTPEHVLCTSCSQAGVPEYFPDPSAVMAAGVSRSDFSEAAAGSSKLFGIITSGTGTCENHGCSCQMWPGKQTPLHLHLAGEHSSRNISPTKAETF